MIIGCVLLPLSRRSAVRGSVWVRKRQMKNIRKTKKRKQESKTGLLLGLLPVPGRAPQGSIAKAEKRECYVLALLAVVHRAAAVLSTVLSAWRNA